LRQNDRRILAVTLVVLGGIAIAIGYSDVFKHQESVEFLDFKVDRMQVRVGEPVTVTFDLKNKGLAAASSISISTTFSGDQAFFKIDNSSLQNISQIGAGGTSGPQKIVITGLSTGIQSGIKEYCTVSVSVGQNVSDFESFRIALDQ
jgi:hypothetical protein